MDTIPPPARGARPDLNRATMLPLAGLALGPRVEAAAARDAWALGLATLRRGATPAGSGFHLFWVHGRTVGTLALSTREGDYAVLGRHTHCDAVLPDDPEVSLRHVLARVVTLDDGIALRLLELQASLPLYTEAGEPTRSLLASGPLTLRLGSYVIGAVPFGGEGEGGSPELPEEPPRSQAERSEVLPRSASPGRGRITHITLLPAVSDLGVSSVSSSAGSVASLRAGHARLALSRGGLAVSVELSEHELELGVIVGRSHRCLDRGLRAVLTESVSRAHLLLLREREATWAYDLGSVQGTWQQGRQVRRVRLRDDGSRLVLAETDSVVLDWIARPA